MTVAIRIMFVMDAKNLMIGWRRENQNEDSWNLSVEEC